mmetsp:Transcript_7157/g.10284  ORF Transcript_7157/g.10284 Transcript_7157/m.10284 type:complete len:214 (+) Transcript_7157:41-682(+)|eukprot:CAMPEP_0194765146 /NCGR_PEP_ID=MMETSP0323_2-20130528/25135_1 /TAXON_ID=2866 ORGANISM="Crypthecodinium cohnii, Strain Seligo" /NCGR_SAMPLE_ID=MMETSP0323_2 /ASSEMBLY_ACC=CAM_ASM_000346 /LENGTH=213 /DNA_ID=CAMNT_0039693939 /DNA_START=42 /DNA_END=683 /DNA_ORIENTATION=-
MPGQPGFESPSRNEVQTNVEDSPHGSLCLDARRLRGWSAALLVVLAGLLVLRWHFGDAHGALLMFAVWAVGVLALSVGTGNVDAVYGGYFGLMAFVSGLLDLNIAIEHLVWLEWKDGRHRSWWDVDPTKLIRPTIYLACSFAQLVASFVAYLVYKDADFDDIFDMQDETIPLFASQDQARVYNAALRYSERHTTESPGTSVVKPFAGTPHKLP